MNDLFSRFGIVTGARLVDNVDKEFSGFILVHFNDAESVASVLKNKDNIIIDECKFNVSEPKVKNDDSSTKSEKKSKENRIIKISNIEPALEPNGVTKSDDLFYIKADVVNGRLQQRNTGKIPFPPYAFHIIRVKEAFR